LTKHRLDARSAADALGISVDAVRMRARRGSLESEHRDGRLYVWVNADETGDETGGGDAPLVAELKDRIRYLEETVARRDEEIRRRDHLLAAALERIPALEEAPLQPRESPETASEAGAKGDVSEEGKRPWWRFW
jgi:hypothetical protein